MRKNIITILISFVICFVSCNSISKNFESDDKDSLVIQLITYVLDQAHYLDIEIDDNFSEKVFNSFLENIDPYKRYMYQSDIDILSKYTYEIDDAFNQPNLEFFNLAHEILIKRIDEGKQISQEVLSKPFDFQIEETFNFDIDELQYVSSRTDLVERWRKLMKVYLIENYHDEIKEDERTFKKDSTYELRSYSEIETETRETLNETMADYFIIMEEEFQRQHWFSIYLNSFVSQFDPNTSYLDPEDRDRFNIDMSGNYAGIGAVLRKKVDKIEITELISGGPAWRNNSLEKGDVILKVRQENDGEPVSIVGYRLADAVKLIKGEKGTNVFLTVKKVDGTVNEISIERDIVLLEETYIKSSLVEKDGNNYGIINIPKFYIDFENQDNRDASKDLKIEINRLKEQAVQGLVIDLRNNGGGSLKTVVDMAGMFIESGPVVQVKYFDKEKQVLRDRDRSILWNGPLVILVNEGSASASEILAAAMQDYERAIIIGGNQTWGKGTVQNVFPLNRMVRGNTKGDLGALRYTTQKYYRVNGGSVQLEGVKSDINLPFRYKYLDFGEKDSENPLQWDEIENINYKKWNSNFDFDFAIKNSQKRIKESEHLKLVDENAKWIKDVREKKIFNLNYQKFRSELEQNIKITDKFKKLDNFSLKYSFKSLPYESQMIENDSILGTKRERWHKSLNKDIYIGEALNVLSDLRFSYLEN